MRGGLSKKTCIKCSTYPITVSLQSCWYFRTILQTGRLRFRAPKGCLRGRLDFSTRLLSTCSISWPPPPFNDVISAAPAQMPFLSNWCFYLFFQQIFTEGQVWILRELFAPSPSQSRAPWEEIQNEWGLPLTPHSVPRHCWLLMPLTSLTYILHTTEHYNPSAFFILAM